MCSKITHHILNAWLYYLIIIIIIIIIIIKGIYVAQVRKGHKCANALPCDVSLKLQYIFQIDAIFDIRISQGSVATCLRRGGIFKYEFVANLLLSPPVKKV